MGIAKAHTYYQEKCMSLFLFETTGGFLDDSETNL